MRPEVARCEWSRASCWGPTASPGLSATPPASPAWQCSTLPSPPRPPCRDSSPSSGGTPPHLPPQLAGWSTGAEVALMWRTQIAPGGGVCVPKRHRPGALHREGQLVSLPLSLSPASCLPAQQDSDARSLRAQLPPRAGRRGRVPPPLPQQQRCGVL